MAVGPLAYKMRAYTYSFAKMQPLHSRVRASHLLPRQRTFAPSIHIRQQRPHY